ncbi:MAG: hypothetical protein RRA32_03565 [bacterium]|nr:hypothetical protein [bacterium]
MTFRKALVIGTGKESDFIVNHPFLHDNSQTLAVNAPRKGMGKNGGENIDRGKVRWSTDVPGLQIRCRSLKLPVLLAAVSLLAAILLALVLEAVRGGSSAQDWSAIPLPAREAYGFCRQDHNHRDGILYSFEAEAAEPHDITFVPGGEGDGSTLSLSVNQNPPLNSIKLPEGWGMKRVVRIPAKMIQVGENTIEFRRFSQLPDTNGWGVKEVESIRTVERPMDQAAVRQTLEGANNLLKEQVLDGPDLGRLYGILNKISIPNHLPELSSMKNSVLDMVHNRMIEILQETTFQIRSARIMGDEETAGKLAARTRDWIPEEWEEGWRILNGF